MAHEWKFGDWAESGVGLVRFVSRQGGVQGVFVVAESGWIRHYEESQIVYLPECTGWDWKPPKPIEPPEGYRLIREGGFVAKGDLLLANDGGWYECLSAGTSMSGGSARAYARKIEPRYRPFASAAEFAPHRDKWVRWKDGDEHLFRVGSFHNSCAWPACATVGRSYADAFKNWLFEDGSPFGVLELEPNPAAPQ